MIQRRVKNKCSNQGFTLLEVVIALAVVSFGILSLMAMQVGTIKGNAFANTMTRATYTGSDVIELLQALPYSDPVYSVAAADNPHTEADLPSANLGPGVNNVQWVVTNNVAIANTKDVVVTVNYRDKSAVKNLVLNFSKVQLL